MNTALIIEEAKSRLTQFGTHPRMLFVEVQGKPARDMDTLVLEDRVEAPTERDCFNIGIKASYAFPDVKAIREICFLAIEHRQQRELLVLTRLIVESFDQYEQCIEIKRNARGKVQMLLNPLGEVQCTHLPLLSFYLGIAVKDMFRGIKNA
jgi:hypothetical protein